MARSKDLFDESTMTFGEHLEALRLHLFKAILGLVVATLLTVYYGTSIVDMIRRPLDAALKRNKLYNEEEVNDYWSQFKGWLTGKPADSQTGSKNGDQENAPAKPPNQTTILVHVKPSDILSVLHSADPKRYPAPEANSGEKAVSLPLAADEFRDMRQEIVASNHPITLKVQEAFMMYLWVSLVAGFVVASPWIFYQMWQFVAAGLYPHERKYVHVYFPMSIGLFLTGVLFAFYLALPLVLDFLLGFNRLLGVVPQIQLSEWVSFVILLPVMFGISFQLPLIMLFLERLGIVTTTDYRTRRRLAVLVMAVAAMLLNPAADLGTMMLMFVPLVFLYEFGILLCAHWKMERPFEEPAIG
jgi:sec-independent protein translocase protein TatC